MASNCKLEGPRRSLGVLEDDSYASRVEFRLSTPGTREVRELDASNGGQEDKLRPQDCHARVVHTRNGPEETDEKSERNSKRERRVNFELGSGGEVLWW